MNFCDTDTCEDNWLGSWLFIVFSDLSGVGCVVIGEPECPLIISSAVCEEECFKHSNARCITQMLLLSQIPKSLMPSCQQLRLSWSSSPRVDHINKHELGSRSNDWVGYESVSRSLKDEESKITPIDDSKTATILLQASRWDWSILPRRLSREEEIFVTCGASDCWCIDHFLMVTNLKIRDAAWIPASSINPWFSSVFNAWRIQRISRHLSAAVLHPGDWRLEWAGIWGRRPSLDTGWQERAETR